MLYLPILTTAWRTALRERRLWWYALFAGLLIGTGIGTGISQTFGVDPSRGALAVLLDPTTGTLDRTRSLWAQALATGTGSAVALAALGILLLAIVLLIVWLAVVSANALMLATEHARSASVPRDLTRRAAERFWPSLTIHLMLKLATVLILFGWSALLATVAATDAPAANARGVIAFVVTAILLSVLHMGTPYAIASAVLDRRGPLTAIREGLILLRDRWLISLEASALLTLANVVGVVAWLMGALLLALPFLFLGGIAIARDIGTLLTIAVAGGLAVLVAYLVLVMMVFTTFLVTSWTLLYLRLTGPGEEPEPWLTRRLKR